jgi:P-type Ca2+ transporter type 2C
MSDDELARRIQTVSVFARKVPEQKLQLIRALKANGEIVGMTGTGSTTPGPADIGIAMGARGTDVARESAALVITDDDFTSIVGGIRQGRGIFGNLRKAMAYIIAVHVPIFGMSLIPVFVAIWPPSCPSRSPFLSSSSTRHARSSSDQSPQDSSA